MKHLNTPLGQKVHSVDTVAEMTSLSKSNGLECVYCVGTATLYSFVDSLLVAPNGTSILATGSGGDTRWVGMGGQFSYYPLSMETEINIIQDVFGISNFSQPHFTCYIPTTNQIFVGCRSNYVFAFDADDLTTPAFIQNMGAAINTGCYDAVQDKVYFIAGNHLWEYDPALVTTTDLGVPLTMGASPAIASDGTYIYGVTYTDPAEIFKIEIANPLNIVTQTWTNGRYGHACSLYEYASKTELYCTSTDSNLSSGKSQFAAVDCDSMMINIDIAIPSYQCTDDMCYQNVDDVYGYCYATPENNHIGSRIKTDDGTVTEFYSPYSYGSFTDGDNLYILDYLAHSIFKYPGFELDKYEVYAFTPTFEQQRIHIGGTPTVGSFVINFTNNMLLTINAGESVESIQANLSALRPGVTDFFTVTGSLATDLIITFNGVVGNIADVTIQDNTLDDGSGTFAITVTVSEEVKGAYNYRPNEFVITPSGRMFYTTFSSPCHIGEISLNKWQYAVPPYSLMKGEDLTNTQPYTFIQGLNNINEANYAVLLGNFIYNKGENAFIMENLNYPLTGLPITTAYKTNTESNIAKFFGNNRITAEGFKYYPRNVEQTYGQDGFSAPVNVKPTIPMEKYPQDVYYASLAENYTTPGIYDDGDSLSYSIYPYYESTTEGQVFGNPYTLGVILSVGITDCSIDINDITLNPAQPLQLAPTGYRFVRLYNGTTSFVDIAYASPINLNDNGTDVGGIAWTTLSEADAISPAAGTGCIEETFGVPGVSSFASLAVGHSSCVGSSRSSLRGSISTKIRNIYKSETIAPDDHIVNLMAAGLTLQLTTVDSSIDRHYYINNISTGNVTVIPDSGSTDLFTDGTASLVLRPGTSVHLVAQYNGGSMGAIHKWRAIVNTSILASLVDLDLKVPIYTDHFWNALNKEWVIKDNSGTVDFPGGVNGTVTLTTGAVIDDIQSIHWDDIYTFNTSNNPHFEFKVKYGSTATTYSEVGFYNNTEYMKFYVDTSVDQYWRFEVSNGGAPVTITTTNEISMVDQVLKFDWIDGTNVAIWIDGILVGTADITTAKPANDMQPIMLVKTLDTVAAIMNSDYIKIWQDEVVLPF